MLNKDKMVEAGANLKEQQGNETLNNGNETLRTQPQWNSKKELCRVTLVSYHFNGI